MGFKECGPNCWLSYSTEVKHWSLLQCVVMFTTFTAGQTVSEMPTEVRRKIKRDPLLPNWCLLLFQSVQLAYLLFNHYRYEYCSCRCVCAVD